MMPIRAWRGLVLLTCIAGSGCTTLREIPSTEYTARVQERPVRVVTREGLSYQLDEARVEGDTLIGYRRRDVEGPIDEFDSLRLPLDQVASISARRIDWYRTGLVGTLSVAAIVVAGLSRHGSNGGTPSPIPCSPKPDNPCP
jgi:hypothetical protein